MKRVVVTALAILTIAASSLPGNEEPPPFYELSLVYVNDGPELEFLFVIGNSGFRSVDSLKDFLASRPAGATLRWAPGCIRMGGEPLLSSEADMEEFREFCREHGIVFELVPSG